MTQPKPISDLIGALKDLLTIREAPTTGDEARMNRVAKQKARRLIEEYEQASKQSVNMFTQVQTKMGIENEK